MVVGTLETVANLAKKHLIILNKLNVLMAEGLGGLLA